MWECAHVPMASRTSPRSPHIFHIPSFAHSALGTFAARIPSGHAKRHFHPLRTPDRERTHRHRPGLRVRLLRLPSFPLPPQRRHRGHADQQQPRHHHDRSGHGGQRVPEAAHRREHRGDPQEAQDRRRAAHHGRPDRAEPRHRMREARHLEGARRAHDRCGRCRHRHHRGPRAVPPADGTHRCAHGAEQDRGQLPRRQEGGAGVRLPAGDPCELHAGWCGRFAS